MIQGRFRRVMWAVVYFVLIGMLMCVMDARGEEVNIEAVIQIESGGNPYAYNEKSGAIGLCQITPIVLREFEKFPKREMKEYIIYEKPFDYLLVPKEFLKSKYPDWDLYNPDFNLFVSDWYLNTRIPQMLRAYKIPDTIQNRLISYNAGIKVCKDYHRGKIKRLPKETRNYLIKYHKLTRDE